jgi:hypothetical protein
LIIKILKINKKNTFYQKSFCSPGNTSERLQVDELSFGSSGVFRFASARGAFGAPGALSSLGDLGCLTGELYDADDRMDSGN